jgi:N-carbamoyl-L-amino-acid hydrolase
VFAETAVAAIGAFLVWPSLLRSDVAPQLRIRADRILRHLRGLSEFGRTAAGGAGRVAFSDADKAAREYVLGLMSVAGLETTVDVAANLVGRRAGSLDLPPLMFGSHIDSVPEGGNYDGPVGSVSAIEVAQTLAEEGIQTRHPLEVVIFSNEEGDPDRLAAARREPGDIAAYLELHVEQGGILESRQAEIGVVEGIVGIKRWSVTVTGFANHAGTTPMDQRRDALVAAAEFIRAVSRTARDVPGRHVATVGRIQAEPGAPNVISGEVTLSLEIRDLEMERIDQLFTMMEEAGARIGAETGTTFAFDRFYVSRAAPTDERIRSIIERVTRELSLSTLRMPSGAGHDAQSIARLAPVGMIFVPSVRGISHSPQEFSWPRDIVNGANVLLHTLLNVDSRRW